MDNTEEKRRPPRLELYVRSLAPMDIRETQEQVVKRLQSLESGGQISEFTVTVCGESICSASTTVETDIGRQLLDCYKSADEWATEHDRELLGFERHETKSQLAGTAVTGISFPRLLLLEVDNGRVEYVAPSRNGTETTSVLERLETY